MSGLEAHYRRLLAWYPMDHRAVHEDEMIGVLLASAEPGQTRPDLRDRGDLLWSAVKLHARRAFGRGSMSRWRDSAAIVAVISMVLFTLRAVSDAVAQGVGDEIQWTRPVSAGVIAAVFLLAVAANVRLVAVPVAGLLFAYVLTSWLPWLTPIAGGKVYPWTTGSGIDLIALNGWALFPIVAGVAVALTARPRRGFTTLGVRRLALWIGVAAVTLAWAQTLHVLTGQGHTTVQSLPFLTACAAACGLALRSERGRRVTAIFAPLLVAQVAVTIYIASVESPWAVVALLGIVPALVFGGLGWWQVRRRGWATTPRTDEQLAEVTAPER
jgi:hypothetical protein